MSILIVDKFIVYFIFKHCKNIGYIKLLIRARHSTLPEFNNITKNQQLTMLLKSKAKQSFFQIIIMTQV